MKRNVIVTASDSKFGDFLIDHWLKSLETNVNLEDIDVVVLDYGLSDTQRKRLSGVNVLKYVRDGHVVNLRYRDLVTVCDMGYEQVLLCDSGDLIFQSDISHLFTQHKTSVRGVVEYDVPYDSLFLHKFKKEVQADITAATKGKGLINGGLILASANLFKEIAIEYLSIVNDLKSFGPDQLGVTYLSYKRSFAELDRKYNFIINSFVEDKFVIKNGVFYFASGEVIPVVHNAGRYDFFRPIKNFGFGKDRNKLGLAHIFMPIILRLSKFFFRK